MIADAATFAGRAWSLAILAGIATLVVREWAAEWQLRRELRRVEREQAS
jgi:hypothetical protein